MYPNETYCFTPEVLLNVDAATTRVHRTLLGMLLQPRSIQVIALRVLCHPGLVLLTRGAFVPLHLTLGTKLEGTEQRVENRNSGKHVRVCATDKK